MPTTLPRVAPDIGPILSLIRKTRLLLKSSWGAIGVAHTLGLAFLALAVATTADLLVPLVGPWLRLTGLILFAAPTVVLLIWKGVLPLSRQLRNVDVARRIESHIPGMHSRLVSCMDLADRQGEVSPAFYRKLVDESLDRIGKFQRRSVVDFCALRRALLVALIGIGLFGLLWLALGSRLTTALARVLDPFADLPPIGDIAYTVVPGTTKVLTGEDVTFAVAVTRGEPESLNLELTGIDATVRYPLDKGADGVWRRTLRGLSSEKGFEHGFTFRVFGGRTWTRQNRIDWVERPVILDTAVKLHFPEYMGIPEPLSNPPRERDVIGPAGSRVEVLVEVAGEVAAGEIQLLETRVKTTPNQDAQSLAFIAGAGCSTLFGMRVDRESVVAGTYALQRMDAYTWVGRFPHTGVGQYRIELRNELGHTNKATSEHSNYEALVDQPPAVRIISPAADLVLSKPDKLAIQIFARDDFGLLDLWLAVQKDGEPNFMRIVKVKEYATPNPLKVDTMVGSLDLTATGFNLKAGEAQRYRAEVRDRRPNSEPAFSQEFSVRIAVDENAADKLLEAFEKGQEAVRDKLTNLVAEQKKVKEKIDDLQKKDATKVQQALTELQAQEAKNVAIATQLDQELKNLAAQAKKTPLLNGEINYQIQNLSGRFKSAALEPLQDLASKLHHDANATTTAPHLHDTKAQSDRVQKNLESLQSRLDALADAQRGLKTDAEQAIAKLKDDLLREQGKMTARDLEDLKDFLKNLREDLKQLQGKQEDLADKTEKAPDSDLPDVEQKQLTLDELLKKDLDLAKKILDREKARRLLKDFPEEPKERTTIPKEDDTSADGKPMKKGNSADPVKKKNGMDDEDLFKPALNGEREKLDPRFETKLRPMPKKGDRREDLQDHQQDNLRNLDAAQKGLKSDEQSLEEMIQSLMNAATKSNPNEPKESTSQGKADDLMKMLQSEAMKNAMDMAQRAKLNAKGQPQQGQPNNLPPSGTGKDSLMGHSIGAAGILDDLDPRTRTTILQLPPGVREELLQGMKSQGPDGYQKFIQDYFRRLSAERK
jgi:hypothetical protein